MSVSAVHVTLQSDHGYIPLVAVGAGLVSTWAGFKVGKARRKFGILYPQVGCRCIGFRGLRAAFI